MAISCSSLSGVYTRFKPHLLMVVAQIDSAFLYFITQASFNHGMNTHVYITYRHIAASIILLPFAYFLERNTRPKLTLPLFLEIFMLSLFAIAMSFNMYFASMRYTSPTFVASAMNTISALTFVIAVVLRLETLNLRNARSIAKVLGTLASLAGVTIMTVYKGPVMRKLWLPLIHIPEKKAIHEQWLKGSLLSVGGCVSWSIGYIMQATTLKRYPSKLSLATWMCFLGAVQSAFFTVFIAHKPAAWIIGFNIDLFSTIYGGVVVSALNIFFQLWCTKERGPVFVTMFSPLSTILVAVLAYCVFGQKLYLGSIIGTGIVIVGLYLLLWSKEGDHQALRIKMRAQSFPTYDEERHPKISEIASAEIDIREADHKENLGA